MIEWIFGAIVVGGLFGGRRKKGPRPSVKVAPTDPYETEAKQWRMRWAASVDRTRWIPKSMASRTIAAYPPPKRPSAVPSVDRENRSEQDLLADFGAHNIAYLKRQKERLKSFFETVEKNPLTEEQMDGCICMDDAVQIVAAAGSGKTSTMVAKVGYALHEGLVLPGQVLALAFNRNVAGELRTRISARLAAFDSIETITVNTFNAFGLAVIAKATGRKPSIAPWVVEPGKDVDKIVEIIDSLRDTNRDFRHDWDLFRMVFGRQIGSWDAPMRASAYRDGQRGILTANGEIVKSEEERMIADWLFYHGVEYRYEQPYEYDTASVSHRQYFPDFHYPQIGLYHEHFALNERGKAPPHFEGDYLAGVIWKRKIHASMGTQLFETKSCEIRRLDGFSRLRAKLEEHGLTLEFDPDRQPSGQAPMSNKQLALTIRSFQQHVKSNGLTPEQLLKAAAKHGKDHLDRLSRFLALYQTISGEWQRRLREADCVDFDDMLLMAIDHIESGRYVSPYLMVLADEFQDTSRAKVRLLKALLKSAGPEAHLCVVGDDWQGINRFAGADISVMTEFEKVFDNSTRLMLGTTFRCPAPVCQASSAFVQANPRQIRKEVATTSPYTKKALFAFAAETLELADAKLEDDLQSMHDFAQAGRLTSDTGGRITVMILGRYHNDAPRDWRHWERRFAGALEIQYRTVHSAKGLEADYVMLVNVVEGLMMGFPSQITDDPVLQIAMPEADPYPLAEERRLFYVALTRARRQVRIYTQQASPSRFLIELAHQGALSIETDQGVLSPCPKCDEGTLRLIEGQYGPFEACSSHPRCDFRRSVSNDAAHDTGSINRIRLTDTVIEGQTCPTCGAGAMVIRRSGTHKPFFGCSEFPSCKTTAAISDIAIT